MSIFVLPSQVLVPFLLQYEEAQRNRPKKGSVDAKDGQYGYGEREIGDRFETEDGANGGHFDTKPEKVHRVERAGSVEEEVPIKKVVAKLCSLFAETALQLVDKIARKKVKSIFRIVSDLNF